MKNKALCPNYKKCGGCQLQNLDYGSQLALKQSRAIKLLGKYARVEPIEGMENPLNYRNKMQSAFSFRSGRTVMGIYQSASRKVVEVDNCLLEDAISQKIAKSVKKLAISFKLKSFDLATERGFLRHILIRRSFSTGEIMVVIVTAKGDFPSKRNFVASLLRLHPEITTVVWNINSSHTPLFLGDKSEILFGNGFITDKLLGLSFRISPKSFYQVNPIQAERLYQTALEFASLSGRETVIDAYCGTGTIGLCMADKAKKLIGVEVNSDSVADARVNAKLNNIENAEFVAADAGDFMSNYAESKRKVNVVVTDPPRSGCSPKFIKSLLKLAPDKIVYISCNPETLSRDLYSLTRDSDYKVKRIKTFDMFPFTEHIETICLLHKQIVSN